MLDSYVELKLITVRLPLLCNHIVKYICTQYVPLTYHKKYTKNTHAVLLKHKLISYKYMHLKQTMDEQCLNNVTILGGNATTCYSFATT